MKIKGKKQIKVLADYWKKLINSSSEKLSLTILKENEIFKELANERIYEIQDLSKQIDFNTLVYYFKAENVPKNVINFKGPLAFYRNIKDGYTTLGKAEENKKNIKSV